MDQRLISGLMAGILVGLFIVFLTSQSPVEPEPLPVACTLEAQICSDGSAVGRTGPDCEFEECPHSPEHFGVKVGEAANVLWGKVGVIYPKTNEVATEGWLRYSFSVPKGAEMSSECYIFMKGEQSRKAAGGTFIENGPQGDVCQIQFQYANCNMFINIDLEGLKAGYDLAEDNWDEFITCVGDGEFCQEECDKMLEILMTQERETMAS